MTDCSLMQSEARLEEEWVLAERYSRRLLYSSLLSIFSVLISLHYGLYDFALISAAVLVNSINYWRYPVRGARRNIDILCAGGACLYQMLASFSLASPLYFTAYWLTLLVALFSYYMARRCHLQHDDMDQASRWHRTLHVWANVSNALLYYGFSLQ